MRTAFEEAALANYWWVNHKQTVRMEREGGYLWSPRTKANGDQNRFYDNMRRARPGDAVVSYANAMVGAVGIVTDVAVAAPKPEAFGFRGEHWGTEGWLVPVSWSQLSQPFSPAQFLGDIAPLLPDTHSPIRAATGHGNQGAYLAEISKELFSEVLRLGNAPNMESLRRHADDRPAVSFIAQLEAEIEKEIAQSSDLSSTEKEQVILARRGQGKFRRNVTAYETACRCTGIAIPGLLIASHIKPWRACSNAIERLDGSNGLLLSPSADYLFDLGFISFSDGGDVLLSNAIAEEEYLRLGIRQKNVGSFLTTQKMYLDYHRSNIYRD
jgi:putative restriction endonuclease